MVNDIIILFNKGFKNDFNESDNFRELRFGSLKENNLTQDCSISVLPVMRAGLVGYVTTKSSVLLKSIPDEVLENAEVKPLN